MSFFNLLKEEHQEARKVLKTLVQQENIDKKKTEEICQKLLLHMEMEEKYFYPCVKNVQDTADLEEEAVLEHKEAKRAIKQILGRELDEVAYKVQVEMLQLEIEHHVEEEENELFPKAKKILSKAEVQEITGKMEQLKESKTREKVLARKA